MKDKEYKGHKYKPETLMMGYGYDPSLSEFSAKPPLFLTSTFVFPSAQKGKSDFELAYGLREKKAGEECGLIYSRVNNPNLQILEERVALWDNMDRALVFSSGMAAISTFMLSVARPGDTILSTVPVYGGTYFLLADILPRMGIRVNFVDAGSSRDVFETNIKKIVDSNSKLRCIFVETPANPTNVMTDLKIVSDLKEKYSEKDNKILLAVDNTFLGPIFQSPKEFGADAVIYSATKFIGGHSDLVAGVVSTSENIAKELSCYRTILGSMCGPFEAWLMMRSLETLKIRMEKQCEIAQKLVAFLNEHPKIEKVTYPTLLKEGTEQYRIYKEQAKGSGSLITFKLKGGESETFTFLNSLKLYKLAVSLGGTESLIQHPKTMTHSDVPCEEQKKQDICDNTVRISVGLESPDDLIFDIKQALDCI